MRLVLLLALGLPLAGFAAEIRPGDYDSISDALKDKRCMRIIEKGFGEIVTGRRREIEGSEPGRFWKDTTAFALRERTPDGHFLSVRCLSVGPCADRAAELESRLLNASVLDALPLKKGPYYDPRTWELTSLGEKILKAVRKRFPNLEKRLAPQLFRT